MTNASVISMNREEQTVGVHCGVCEQAIPRDLIMVFAKRLRPEVEHYKAEDLLGIGFTFLEAHCELNHPVEFEHFNQLTCQIIDENMLLDGEPFHEGDWTE